VFQVAGHTIFNKISDRKAQPEQKAVCITSPVLFSFLIKWLCLQVRELCGCRLYFTSTLLNVHTRLPCQSVFILKVHKSENYVSIFKQPSFRITWAVPFIVLCRRSVYWTNWNRIKFCACF